MKKYEEFTEKLKEHAIYDMDLSKFDNYLTEINDSIKTLKNFKNEINYLIDLLKDINKDDIYLDDAIYNDDENYRVTFNLKINALILSIKEFYKEIKMGNNLLYNKINIDYFDGSKLRLEFDVEIDRGYFNKFHFPINLPIFLKNIGLCKKIILKSINDFNYCLFTKQDSVDLKIVIESITKNNQNYYSFIKDVNVLIFRDDFNIIKQKLKEWFKSPYDNYILDKNFHDKYLQEINNDYFLSNLYKKYKNNAKYSSVMDSTNYY